VARLESMSAVFTIANLPLAVMLIVVASVSLRYRDFLRGWPTSRLWQSAHSYSCGSPRLSTPVPGRLMVG
jgi:hypothetical protein